MNQCIYVGLDVHLNSITAAVLDGDVKAPQVIKLSGDLMQTRRLFRRLAKKGPVRACYEASGAGFVLQRVLTKDGFHCEVIAPSLIPRKPGDRRKTDRLDATNLVRLYKSGHLTPVHIPSREQEALRRLIRLRYEYVCYTTGTKNRITGMLRNHGLVFTEGKSTWTKTHRRWLATVRDELHGAMQPLLPPNSNTSSISRPSAASSMTRSLDTLRHRPTAPTSKRSVVYVASRSSRRCPCSPRSVTSGASPHPQRSWPTSGSFLPSDPVASVNAAVPLPKPATLTAGVSSQRPPGTTVTAVAQT